MCTNVSFDVMTKTSMYCTAEMSIEVSMQTSEPFS